MVFDDNRLLSACSGPLYILYANNHNIGENRTYRDVNISGAQNRNRVIQSGILPEV